MSLRSVCVFCGASPGASPIYREAAEALGQHLAKRGMRLIYGGEIGKWDLDGTRYMAIMGASWLVAVPLAGVMEQMAASRLGVALQQIGRGGLFSFLACVLLSVLGDAFQMNPLDQGILRRMAVDVWAMVALWWVSALWLTYGAPWQMSITLRPQRKG